jgi:hypothetical protein
VRIAASALALFATTATMPGPRDESSRRAALLQHFLARLVRAAAPIAFALAFTLAPLAGGGGFAGRNGRVIYVKSNEVRATGTATPLATDAAGSGASLSPDSTRIAYTAAAGVHVHCLVSSCSDTNLASGSSDPSWSPDGTKIAYVVATHIALAAPDGTGAVDTGAIGAEPAWSPDGTKIAFASLRGSHYEIWTVAPVLNGVQTQVTGSLGSDDRQPAWSPDGSLIAFHSNRSGTDQIYVVSSGGGSLTQLTNDAANPASAPVWSPDGTTIAFARDDGVWTIPAAGGTAVKIEATTGAPRPETADWETLAPTNSTAPTVSFSDPPAQGQAVTAFAGTWNGATSFMYQWQRCDPDLVACVNVGAASASSSYTLGSADVGMRIRVAVSASNTAGSSAAVTSSNVTPVVLGPGPTNVSPPTISSFGSSGAPRVGSSLSASVGRWTGSGITYSYQWWKCDAVTKACSDLPGSTGSFLTLDATHFGWQMRVLVTARNADGAGTAVSALTASVTADLPVNVTKPTLSGLNVVGETLFVGTGTWNGTLPITYSYQWRRCDPQGTLASCVAIPGATSSVYELTDRESGVAVRAYVTGRNVAGAAEVFTDHTFPTLPAGSSANPTSGRPASSALPAIVGTPATGAMLTARAGTWTGRSPITYGYAWRRCDATGAACKGIAGATRRSYTVQRADVGFTLRVAVVARNPLGSTSALSAPSDTVQMSKPVPRGRHLVGTRNADYLPGGGGHDFIEGRSGNDTLLGGAGNDRLVAGQGNDVIDGGSGTDRVDGGPGSDTVRAADGERDRIDCGDGRDHAVVDPEDVVTGCELVTFGTTPTPTTPTPTTPTPTTPTP